MKRWNNVNLDDEAKRTMSRDSENARSHPIKPVTIEPPVLRGSPTPSTICSSARTGAFLRGWEQHRAVRWDLLLYYISFSNLNHSYESYGPHCWRRRGVKCLKMRIWSPRDNSQPAELCLQNRFWMTPRMQWLPPGYQHHSETVEQLPDDREWRDCKSVDQIWDASLQLSTLHTLRTLGQILMQPQRHWNWRISCCKDLQRMRRSALCGNTLQKDQSSWKSSCQNVNSTSGPSACWWTMKSTADSMSCG